MIKQIVIPLRYRYLGTLLIWVMTFLLLFAGADFKLENNVWVSDGLTTLVSLIGFALCAGLFLRMIFRFAAGNKPALLISRDGLFFCSPYGAKYYMPWNEIKEIRSTPLSLFQFLYIFREKKPVIAIQGMVLAVPLDEVLRDIYQSGYYKGVIAGWSPESSAKPKTREKTKLKISYHSKVSAFERVGFMTLLLTAGAFSSFKLSGGFNYGGAAMLLIMITGW
ncbi:MAG TPA: hypothetical protein VK791_04225, partial [bacterium]|nr:hypothetical protein [bacterium]